MYKLRNETKNDRVRNSLDELTCYLEDSPEIKVRQHIVAATTIKLTTPPPKSIRQPYTPTDYDDEDPTDDDDEYLYDQQESSSNSLPVTQQEDPFVKHLFQIPVEELPCPRSLHSGPTETTNRIEGTPPPDFPFMLTSNHRTNLAAHMRSSLATLSILIALALFT